MQMANLPTSQSRPCSPGSLPPGQAWLKGPSHHPQAGAAGRWEHPSLPASGSERGPKPQGFRMPGPAVYLTFPYNVILLVVGFYFLYFGHTTEQDCPGLG